MNQIIEMSFEDVGDNNDPDFANSTEGILAGNYSAIAIRVCK